MMRTLTVSIWILIILSAHLSGTVYADASDNPAAITIGVLENRTFAFAVMMRRSFHLALETINARGGINGRPIKLIFADDGGEKKMGVEAVKRLVKRNRATFMLGGYSSTNALVMAQTAERLDVPFLVCTAADDRITQRNYENIYRLNPPASEYTQGLEMLFKEKLRPASMSIVYENSPFGTSGAMRMMWFCRENDIEIKAVIPYHRERAGQAYFSRLISPLQESPPEIIYMISYLKDAVALVKHIHSANIDATLCGGAGGFTHPDFLKMAGPAGRNLLTATLWSPEQDDILARHYVDRYRNTYRQTPDYHGAEAYSALMVAADVLRRSNSLKATDLRQALMEADLHTPFGRVKFQSYGPFQRQNSRKTLVLQAKADQYRCVWPREVSIAKLVIPKR